MGKLQTGSHLLLPLAALVLLATCSDDHDSPPPRQDGWVIYLHPDGPIYDNVLNLGIDPTGGKWVSTGYGLSYLDDNNTPLDQADDTWVLYLLNDGACGNMVFLDPLGGLWSQASRVCYLDYNGTPLDKSDDSWVRFDSSDGKWADESGRMTVDPGGGIWIAYVYDGVDYLDHNGTPLDKSDDIWVHFDSRDGLGDTGAVAIAVEPGEGVWFAHFYGVSFLDYGSDPFFKGDDQWVTFDMTDGLVWPWVLSIAIDSAGKKWFGTWDGVSCLDDGGTPLFKGDDRWATFPIAADPNPYNPTYNEVRSIAVDLDGNKWFGTSRTGVLFLDDGGTPFDKSDDYSFYSGRQNGLASDIVKWMIAIDGANGKWVATYEGLCFLP